jgi:hypothetical protein
MPAGGVMPSAGQGAACPACPVTTPTAGQPAKGSEVRMVRCTTHGIVYDTEREVRSECAKGASVNRAADALESS